MLFTKLVGYFTEFAPRSFGYLSLIMLGFKGLAGIKIHIVYYDVIVDVFMVYVSSKHVLILVIEKCLAKLLTDKQSTFRSDFPRSE